MTSPNPPKLACVVIGVDAPGCSVEAVKSLITQSVVPEIVFINSAGGDPDQRMARFGEQIRIIQHGGRLPEYFYAAT